MSGFVVHRSAVVTCTHAGPATAMVPAGRVKLRGMAVVTLAHPYAVIGCAQAAALLPPCVTGQFLAGAMQVKADGMAVALSTGLSLCAPTGTPLLVLQTQLQVKAR